MKSKSIIGFLLSFVRLFQIRSMKVSIGKSASGLSSIPEIRNNLKLPVWPVWGGVLAQLADWTGNTKLSEAIVRTIGGRVVPITLDDMGVSPFLLLAHHSHSFTPLDPIRALTTLFLPEGFPAHPHSGFDTVTYCIDGGLVHRDSEGFKMAYGDGDVQWMRAGRGIIHEEMWDTPGKRMAHKRIELFQLWINLPKISKFDEPKIVLLRSSDIPIWRGPAGEQVRVVCGSLLSADSSLLPAAESTSAAPVCGPGNAVVASPVAVLHVNIPPGGTLSVSTRADSSVVAYVRHGALIVGSADEGKEVDKEVTAGDCVCYRPPTRPNGPLLDATTTLHAGGDGVDVLLLMGTPLAEPVVWRGPIVQASSQDFQRSANSFNNIGMSAFWDYRMPDAEWKQHCRSLGLQGLLEKFLKLGKYSIEDDLIPYGDDNN